MGNSDPITNKSQLNNYKFFSGDLDYHLKDYRD